MMQDDTITLPNSPRWANHSFVRVRGLWTAADAASVQNAIVKVTNAGTSSASVETRTGDMTLLKVKRMVVEGVVSITLRGGRKYEVSLPGDAGKLLPLDLDYISDQIDALNELMDPEEQTDFLPSVNGRVKENSQKVK